MSPSATLYCLPPVSMIACISALLSFITGSLSGAGDDPHLLSRCEAARTRPGAVCAYNIVMMEELQSVLSLGAGGITKLVDPENRKIIRLSNPKYAKEYLEG